MQFTPRGSGLGCKVHFYRILSGNLILLTPRGSELRCKVHFDQNCFMADEHVLVLD